MGGCEVKRQSKPSCLISASDRVLLATATGQEPKAHCAPVSAPLVGFGVPLSIATHSTPTGVSFVSAIPAEFRRPK